MNDYAAERAALLDAADTINRRFVPRDERILAEVAQAVAQRGLTNDADRLAYECGLMKSYIRTLCHEVNGLQTELANTYAAEMLEALKVAADHIEARDPRSRTAHELRCVIEKAQELQQ